MKNVLTKFILCLYFLSILILSGCGSNTILPLRVVADLNIGETRDVVLSNGDVVKLSLLEIKEVRDSLRDALRAAYVKISVDDEIITLSSANYNLPVEIGKALIDCPATKGLYSNTGSDSWGLTTDARIRLWPKGSPFARPGTFVYPIRQKWFAGMTQSGNEPTYVDWGESLANKSIYYHAGHDIGGAEGMDEIISSTDGLVVSSKDVLLTGYDSVYSNPDAVVVLDKRGWLVEYVHLDSIYPAIKPGASVKIGQEIGLIGKQGSSGGWVHLHFQITYKHPVSGKWITEDAYPYVWEAYVNQYKPPLIAVARPHHLAWTDQEVILDGSRSKSFSGDITSYEWTFTDDTTASGPVQKKTYQMPGEYSEVLKVTDSKGNVDYDFTVIQVYDRLNPEMKIPVMQPAYHPTLNIKPGDPVTFLVRTFNTDFGNEIWDFGDGSEPVMVKSEKVIREKRTEGKFAETVHSFSKPGHYVVRVERSDELGIKAIAHLHVEVKD